METAKPQAGFLTLLKKRNFILLWLAQLISMTILNASNYAILVLIEEVTKSTTLVGLAIICFSLPAVIFGAPAGVLVDRMNKRRVLWASNCLRAIATFGFVFSLLVDREQLVPLYLLTFLISTIGQFFTPAEGSAIPMLVDEEEIPSAVSLFNVTFVLSQAVGFILLAPIIISLMPTFHFGRVAIDPVESLYIIIGTFYLVCAGLIALIPITNFKQPQRQPQVASKALGVFGNMLQEMGQGWSFIRKNNALFLSVIQLSFAGVILLVVGELATPFVTRVLLRPPSAMAFVFAPAGIGLVLGSLAMPRLIHRLGKDLAIILGSALFALTMILLPLIPLLAQFIQPRDWAGNPLLLVVIGFCMFLSGIGLDLINIPAQTAVQELTPDWIKGRVLALQLMLNNAVSIPAILFIGAFADIFSVANVIYLLGATVALFGAWSYYYEHKHPVPQKLSNQQDATERVASSTTVNDNRELSNPNKISL